MSRFFFLVSSLISEYILCYVYFLYLLIQCCFILPTFKHVSFLVWKALLDCTCVPAVCALLFGSSFSHMFMFGVSF